MWKITRGDAQGLVDCDEFLAFLNGLGEDPRPDVRDLLSAGEEVVAARAVRMAATDGDMCLFGFEFTSRPAELEPILHGLFNRRDAVRARPARNRPVEVTITSQTDVDVTGTLRDISSTGLGISAALTSERLLGPAKAVDVSLALGRDEEPLRVPATIRNRRCDERGADVIYGLVFAVPVSEPQLQTRIDDYVMQLQRQTLAPTSVA